MRAGTVAVVTIVHGRHDHLRGQIAGLARGERVPDLHVVAAMDDPRVGQVAVEAWGQAPTTLATRVRSVAHAGVTSSSSGGGTGGRGDTGATPTSGTSTLVVTDVPADPRGLPLAQARNLAAAEATAQGADHLIFLDVDCIPGPGTVATYARHLTGRSAVPHRTVGRVTPDGRHRHTGRSAVSAEEPHTGREAPAVLGGDVAYLPPLPPGQRDWAAPDALDRLPEVGEHRSDRVRLAPGESRPEPDLTRFWSLSFAVSAVDFWATGGFCSDYVGYGGEDTDFAQLVRERGGSLTWIGGATAYHQHHPSASPPLQHLEAVVRNAGVFADRWGWWPMRGWLDAFRERGLAAPDDTGRWRVTV